MSDRAVFVAVPEADGVHRIVPSKQPAGAPAPGDGLSPPVPGSVCENPELPAEGRRSTALSLQALHCHHGQLVFLSLSQSHCAGSVSA